MNRSIIGVILAGGKGRRLWPLTQKRAKPAVPIAGKFRLIDIPISNCLHSEIKKIFVLTQFESESLNRHIAQTYNLPPITRGFVQILVARQTLEHRDWFQGSADAVRQNLTYLWDKHADYYVILSGDQLYRMNYQKMVKFHIKNKADITIGVYPVEKKDSSRFGIIRIDEKGRVLDYREKPHPEQLPEKMESPVPARPKNGSKPPTRLLGSMGIYVFSKYVLFDVLNRQNDADFGGGIFPPVALDDRIRTFGYYFDNYWEDIGTIKTFFDAMIDLTNPKPQFNFYDREMPIFTHPRFLPGAKITDSHLRNSILCEGAIIHQAAIEHSIIGIRSIVRANSQLSRVVMMGADYYEAGEEYDQTNGSCSEIGIGHNCVIEDAIIDKNAYVGDNVKILRGNRPEKMLEEANYVIKDKVVIIPKNVYIPANTVIRF